MSIPVAMHVPDGFLSAPVAIVGGAIALGVIVYVLRRSERDLTEDKVPMLGVIAAFIFAVQMLNFPVAGGTSGHLLGATLAAVLLGPWLACLVMAVVLGVQAFGFADGGIAALGPNTLNMGILGALLAGIVIGWTLRAFHPGRTAYLGTVGVVSWCAVMVGAAACSFELAVSDTIPLGTVLPAMLGVHALIGIGEAVITVAAVSAVMATRPDLIALGDFDEPAGAPVARDRPATGVLR
jgi:cobalt/nickel transport system permease protein